jgi:hypothetical protein
VEKIGSTHAHAQFIEKLEVKEIKCNDEAEEENKEAKKKGRGEKKRNAGH